MQTERHRQESVVAQTVDVPLEVMGQRSEIC